MLLEVRPDKGDQLQFDMHMPRAQGSNERGSGGRVRQLRLQRMCIQRLKRHPGEENHVEQYKGADCLLH